MLKDSKILIDNAVAKLISFQNKESKPIVTRFEHFNEICLGGIYPQMIITIAAGTGEGKSFFLQQLEEDMFNKELNPDADEYCLVRCNWEMTPFNLMLRKLSRELKKPIKDIIDHPLSEEEKKKAKPILDLERDERIKYMDVPLSPKKWGEHIRTFLKTKRDKRQILITIDHIALIKEDKGGKKQAMDDLVEEINEIKKEFLNVSFVLLSQLNREIDKRTDIRTFYPLLSDIHNSSTMGFISDVVVVIFNPYKRGKDKYMLVNTKKYDYLSDYMESPSNKNSSFFTKGLMFYHYLKIRQGDIMEMRDIFVEELNFSNVKAEIKQEIQNNVDLLDGGGIEFDAPPF